MSGHYPKQPFEIEIEQLKRDRDGWKSLAEIYEKICEAKGVIHLLNWGEDVRQALIRTAKERDDWKAIAEGQAAFIKSACGTPATNEGVLRAMSGPGKAVDDDTR